MEVFVIGHGDGRGWTDLAAHEDCIFAKAGFVILQGEMVELLKAMERPGTTCGLALHNAIEIFLQSLKTWASYACGRKGEP